jgi:hypothetical protein
MSVEAIFSIEEPLERVASILLGCCNELGLAHVMLCGHRVSTRINSDEVGGRVLRGYFEIEYAGRSASYGRLVDFDHALLTFDDGMGLGSLATVAQLATGGSSLIWGREYDAEYDLWQNAADPIQYELNGRSTDDRSLRWNGLPAPLGRWIVDTSKNPGRRVLRHGYAEAIGHRMLLGAEYFRRVPGASRTRIVSDETLSVTETPEGGLELVAQATPFADERSAAAQSYLRDLLFPPSDDAS